MLEEVICNKGIGNYPLDLSSAPGGKSSACSAGSPHKPIRRQEGKINKGVWRMDAARRGFSWAFSEGVWRTLHNDSSVAPAVVQFPKGYRWLPFLSSSLTLSGCFSRDP